MNKKILFSILSSIALLPTLVFAQNVTIQTMVNAAVDTTFFIAGGVVVILWIITGILFLSAQGAPDKLSAAKKALITASVGTLLIIVASSAMYIIGQAFNIT